MTDEHAQQHRNRMAAKSRQQFEAVAEIGAIAAVADQARRDRCKNDLLEFLVTYFPGTTGLRPFSEGHKRVIARLQTAALGGGRFFNLVYRGFAKTTISVNTALWALLYGHRKLIVLIGANRAAAKELLDAIKSELETNELLQADFPEVCQAVLALEGKNQRCASQTCEGKLTHIEWTKERIVFPTIEGSVSSGSAIVTRGITSAIRGIGHRRADGTQQRPDFVICDDLQTDQSAASPLQVNKRLMTLRKSVLKLAGHTSTIACVVNGTIIEPDDFMDRIRDPRQFPGWQGETIKMVSKWADVHETLWLGEYSRIRRAFDPEMPGDQERAAAEATEFYRQNFEAMNAGCEVSWEHCYDHDTELSAIQHAYNFLIDDGEEVFACECQSEPIKGDGTEKTLKTSDIVGKLSGLKHREVPKDAVRITAHIDVQDESLWYSVWAWNENFTGYLIDCGIWPDQRTLDIGKKRLRTTLSKKYKDLKNPEARRLQALSDLCDELLPRTWLDSQGHEHTIAYAGVDVADGEASVCIRNWVKSCKWSKILKPMMGGGLKPADQPLNERKREDNELRRGNSWLERRDKRVRGGSIITVDTNYWKTFVANRWRAGSNRPKDSDSYRPNEPGALYLWGLDPLFHGTFAAHQCSESAEPLTHDKSGRKVDYWTLKPGKDNEWWDNLVSCAVLADYAGGVTLRDSGLSGSAGKKRKRLTAAELRAQADKKRGAA